MFLHDLILDLVTTVPDLFDELANTPLPELPILTTQESSIELKTTIVPTVLATTQPTEQTTVDDLDALFTTMESTIETTTESTTTITTTQAMTESTTESQTTQAQRKTTQPELDLTTSIETASTEIPPLQLTTLSDETTEDIDTTQALLTTAKSDNELTTTQFEPTTTTIDLTTETTQTVTQTTLTTITTSAPTTINFFESTLEDRSTLIVPLTTQNPFDDSMSETTIGPFDSDESFFFEPDFTTSSTSTSIGTTPPQENTLQQKFVTVEPNTMSTIERQISQDGIEQIIQLETTIGHVLEFTIVRFNTQNPTCDDGNLSLFNGAIGTSSGTIGVICSDETTPLAELGHFFSTGHMAFIYTSAGDYLVEARSVPKDEVFGFSFCGGENVYNSTGMNIASPGFPAKYETDQQCGYILRRPSQGSLLHIDFKSFK